MYTSNVKYVMLLNALEKFSKKRGDPEFLYDLIVVTFLQTTEMVSLT